MFKIRVLIVNDNLDSLTLIKNLLASYKDIKIIGEAVNGNDAVKIALEYDPDIVVMDVNMPIMDGYKAALSISRTLPYVGIILTGFNESIDVIRKAMHYGAGDFLELPLTSEKLINSITTLYRTKSQQKKYFIDNNLNMPKGQPKVISVFSSKGGVGKSVLSINSAVSLKEQTRRDILLIDMDLQFGDVADMLNISPKVNIIDIINTKKNIDISDLDKYIIPHKSGIKILAAPQQPEQADLVKIDDVKDIVTLYRKTFDYIIMDLPPFFNEITLGAIEISDYIFVVTTMEVPTLKNTKGGLEILYTLGCTDEKLMLVLNRFHSNSQIDVKDIKNYLGVQKLHCIDDNAEVVSTSINLGEPLVTRYKDKPISKQINLLCSQVIEYRQSNEKNQKLSFFQRFLGKRGV